jgi:hypothetical protein
MNTKSKSENISEEKKIGDFESNFFNTENERKKKAEKDEQDDQNFEQNDKLHITIIEKEMKLKTLKQSKILQMIIFWKIPRI